jgi:ribose/xylose/arabinose/galactoside ABC-type transport system permease subunit
VLRNGLNLLGTPSFTQQVVIGSVIIVSVLLDMGLRKRQR